MDLTLLATLKDNLLTATNFRDVQDYFLTHFGEKPEFISLGERTQHPLLEAVVTEVAKQLFKGSPRVEQLMLSRIPGHDFLHGGMFVNGCIGTIIHFDDIHKGLVCICSLDGQTHYARFSGRPMRPRAEPSAN